MLLSIFFFFFFFFNDTATTEIYTLSLHDALPISAGGSHRFAKVEVLAELCHGLLAQPHVGENVSTFEKRSEEHTSELQSPCNLVCRLLLEKKKKTNKNTSSHKLTTHTTDHHYMMV